MENVTHPDAMTMHRLQSDTGLDPETIRAVLAAVWRHHQDLGLTSVDSPDIVSMKDHDHVNDLLGATQDELRQARSVLMAVADGIELFDRITVHPAEPERRLERQALRDLAVQAKQEASRK